MSGRLPSSMSTPATRTYSSRPTAARQSTLRFGLLSRRSRTPCASVGRRVPIRFIPSLVEYPNYIRFGSLLFVSPSESQNLQALCVMAPPQP